jgi:hypothetical protein
MVHHDVERRGHGLIYGSALEFVGGTEENP